MAPDDLPVAEFAFPGPLRDQLAAAILAGEKTTTTGLVADYEHENEPLPCPGLRQVVADSAGRPVAVIETNCLLIQPPWRQAQVICDRQRLLAHDAMGLEHGIDITGGPASVVCQGRSCATDYSCHVQFLRCDVHAPVPERCGCVNDRIHPGCARVEREPQLLQGSVISTCATDHDAIRTGLSLAPALGETLGSQLSGTGSATSR
jgi:hypothetical protein